MLQGGTLNCRFIRFLRVAFFNALAGRQVYGNDFNAVGQGALKVLVGEQGNICGNTCEDGSCSLTG